MIMGGNMVIGNKTVVNFFTEEIIEVPDGEEVCDMCSGGGAIMRCFGDAPIECECPECEGQGYL